ncbi:MAG: hypothetical protein ACLQVA_12280 [Candidatus Brocadiia bacterium]
MARLTFYPLGNADCCLIDLENGKKLLFDYADTHDPDNEDDLRIDLPSKLREDLKAANRGSYDAVAFSHLDKDHFRGASDFFFLEYAKKYQSPERIKIATMWVPAALITETAVEDAEGKVIQAEARYRLKEGKGIRVFSRPERLRKWLEDNDLTLESRQKLITDAGQTVPGFTKEVEGVDFFVHSPFAWRLDDGRLEDRNSDAIVMQATFICKGTETKVLFSSDSDHETLTDIVNITKSKKRATRLDWDVCKLPHHCSYLSLGPEKGRLKTKPVAEVQELFEDHGQDRSIMISTSDPIPAEGTKADKDDYPPHRQAANYYKEVKVKHDGEFIVTMEHPKVSAPEPIVIDIDDSKATLLKPSATVAASILSQRAPRAG